MKTRNSNRTTLIAALTGAAAVSSVLTLAGCRGDREDKPPHQFFPDMDDQLKWRPQGQSGFYADGRTMRKPVAGTVGFSRIVFDAPVLEAPVEKRPDWAKRFMIERDDLLGASAGGGREYYTGLNEDGTYIDRIPIAIDRKTIERGQERFNIYCSVCHGHLGDGKGMVGEKWSYNLPSFHDDKYKKPDPSVAGSQVHKDGYIFHTIHYGVIDPQTSAQKMPPYGHAINTKDAWAIVAYFRALQASQEGTAADVNKIKAGLADELDKIRSKQVIPPAATPAPAPAPAAPAPTGGSK